MPARLREEESLSDECFHFGSWFQLDCAVRARGRLATTAEVEQAITLGKKAKLPHRARKLDRTRDSVA
jgi:hypothetical protein